ncbi:cell division protein FtsQ/DivIB [Paenibacillus wulumuqiensis]|uniref:cell division protein FtsQ/DivIB n=1 Tax=Paenibacillus wulumuqiensis TaxID=1567107 RepID=UPI000619F175|nr:FtsQ-type POTRA domain-containing protein [Paenibacillus wulumuqiensis]
MPKQKLVVLPKNESPAGSRPSAGHKRSGRKNRLIILLSIFFLLVLGIVFWFSPLGKISEITFRGNAFTSKEDLLSVTRLAKGNAFYGTSADTIKERLLSIPAIESAAVTKHFPGKIDVTIKEYPVVAYELAGSGQLTAILQSGASVRADTRGVAVEKPVLTQWADYEAQKVQLCKVLGTIPGELTSDISEIIPSPTPSFPDRIMMYTRSRFEVITSISLLADKVEYLNQVIETQPPGVITMLEADAYTPFNPDDIKDETEETPPAQ